MKRLSYKQVEQSVADCGYELVTANTTRYLEVKCKCGGIITTNLSNLRRMDGCRWCNARNVKKTYLELEKAFNDRNCVLLTTEIEYKDKNTLSKVSYVCSCGIRQSILLRAFLNGQSCFECGKQKRRGSNHHNYQKGYKFKGELNPNWNPSLTEDERQLRQKRGDHRYKIWRKAVYTRDNFTCARCKKRGGNLNVHHVENFSECIEKRYDIDNGITFCVRCHDTFHSVYGKVKNNRKQLEEFLCAAM